MFIPFFYFHFFHAGSFIQILASIFNYLNPRPINFFLGSYPSISPIFKALMLHYLFKIMTFPIIVYFGMTMHFIVYLQFPILKTIKGFHSLFSIPDPFSFHSISNVPFHSSIPFHFHPFHFIFIPFHSFKGLYKLFNNFQIFFSLMAHFTTSDFCFPLEFFSFSLKYYLKVLKVLLTIKSLLKSKTIFGSSIITASLYMDVVIF